MKVNIRSIQEFGTVGAIGVHQVCTELSDVDHAMESADRDNFGTVWLYVNDQRAAADTANEVAGMLPDAFIDIKIKPRLTLVRGDK